MSSLVMVTGANGFVGRRVVREFAQAGDRVVAAARWDPEFDLDQVGWSRSPDLGADADWSDTLRGADIVVHCAARVHVMKESASDPLADYRASNVAGTAALARQAAAAGVRRFVFVSSVKVNGEGTQPGHPYRADDAPAPVDTDQLTELGLRALPPPVKGGQAAGQ